MVVESESSVFDPNAAAIVDDCGTPCLTDTPANVDNNIEDRLIQQQQQMQQHNRIHEANIGYASSDNNTPLSTPSTERLPPHHPHHQQHPARYRNQQQRMQQQQLRRHVAATSTPSGVSGDDSDGRHTYTLSKGSGPDSPYEQVEIEDDDDGEEEEDDDVDDEEEEDVDEEEEEDYDDLPPVQLRNPHHQRYVSSSNRHSQPMPADHRVSRPKIKSRSKSSHQGDFNDNECLMDIFIERLFWVRNNDLALFSFFPSTFYF